MLQVQGLKNKQLADLCPCSRLPMKLIRSRSLACNSKKSDQLFNNLAALNAKRQPLTGFQQKLVKHQILMTEAFT